MTDAEDPKFETLLQFLQQQRGFDFTGYKRPSLMRRVARRMQMLAVPDYGDYRDVSGIKFPFEVTFSWLDGRYTAKLSNVQVNVPIEDAIFHFPTTATK